MFLYTLNFIENPIFIDVMLGLIGGLGIFLYGINLMGETLKTIAGARIKHIIEKLTNNVFTGILTGILVTGIIQSSSGTTALSISLIRAGLMSMPQAVGIIMGANIGTTVTAFLFSFPQISDYSLFFVGFGSILIFFFKSRKLNQIGKVILGFGLLFYGMYLMSNGLKAIAETESFKYFMLKFASNPFLGLVIGAIVTALVQSSSATTGIVQSLYESGSIPTLTGAIPILLGNNIGTTITAVIAAIGGSITAKRAAAFHVFFNFFGAILFLLILIPYSDLILILSNHSHASPRLTIAYAHLIFNLANTLLLVWFIKQIIWVIKFIIPGKDEFDFSFNTDVFNDRLIKESPILAIESTKTVILHMGHIVQRMLDITFSYIHQKNTKIYEEGKQLGTIINTLNHKTQEYLVKITSYIVKGNSKNLSKYLDTIRDLERVGDHCESILEIGAHMNEGKGVLTKDAYEDLDIMFNVVISMLDKVLVIIDENDKIQATQVIEEEIHVSKLEKMARKHNSIRVNEGICTSETGFNFIEILSNLERIGDHCCNIAEYTINDEYYLIIDEKEENFKSLSHKNEIKITFKK